MEAVAGLAVAFVAGKILKNNAELGPVLNPQKAVQFDLTYYRDDDVNKEYQSFDPDHAIDDMNSLGTTIGDYEYYSLGTPDPRKEHEYFDPWQWKDKYSYTDFGLPHNSYA